MWHSVTNSSQWCTRWRRPRWVRGAWGVGGEERGARGAPGCPTPTWFATPHAAHQYARSLPLASLVPSLFDHSRPSFITGALPLASLAPSLLHHSLLPPCVQTVGGGLASGKQLAQLLRSLITGLNAKEIPTAASIVEMMNHELLTKALDQYESALAAQQLPVAEQELQEVCAWACLGVPGVCIGREGVGTGQGRGREDAKGPFYEQLLNNTHISTNHHILPTPSQTPQQTMKQTCACVCSLGRWRRPPTQQP